MENWLKRKMIKKKIITKNKTKLNFLSQNLIYLVRILLGFTNFSFVRFFVWNMGKNRNLLCIKFANYTHTHTHEQAHWILGANNFLWTLWSTAIQSTSSSSDYLCLLYEKANDFRKAKWWEWKSRDKSYFIWNVSITVLNKFTTMSIYFYPKVVAIWFVVFL